MKSFRGFKAKAKFVYVLVWECIFVWVLKTHKVLFECHRLVYCELTLYLQFEVIKFCNWFWGGAAVSFMCAKFCWQNFKTSARRIKVGKLSLKLLTWCRKLRLYNREGSFWVYAISFTYFEFSSHTKKTEVPLCLSQRKSQLDWDSLSRFTHMQSTVLCTQVRKGCATLWQNLRSMLDKLVDRAAAIKFARWLNTVFSMQIQMRLF